MREARFHRLAVLADMSPAELTRVLAGMEGRENIVRRVQWAVCVIRADDKARGRRMMPFPFAVSYDAEKAAA